MELEATAVPEGTLDLEVEAAAAVSAARRRVAGVAEMAAPEEKTETAATEGAEVMVGLAASVETVERVMEEAYTSPPVRLRCSATRSTITRPVAVQEAPVAAAAREVLAALAAPGEPLPSARAVTSSRSITAATADLHR